MNIKNTATNKNNELVEANQSLTDMFSIERILRNKKEKIIELEETLLSDFVEKFTPKEIKCVNNYSETFNLLEKACSLIEARTLKVEISIGRLINKIRTLERQIKESNESKS